MTEYELADLINSSTGNATPVLMGFMTSVTGYLVLTWFTGDKLKRSQAAMVSTLFVIYSGLFIIAWAARFQSALMYQNELNAINPERGGLISQELIYGVVVVLVVIVIASLKFMWDIRHPKAE
jgi:hypothetical protein